RFTSAVRTPSMRDNAFSTCRTQEAQVMPPMSRVQVEPVAVVIRIAAQTQAFRPGGNAAPSLRIVVESKMSAITKQAHALHSTKPRQGMPWLRGEATGLPGL